MPGSQVDKTSFDLRNLSLSRVKIDWSRWRLDIRTRMCAGTSLAFSHRKPDGPGCCFWSMREWIIGHIVARDPKSDIEASFAIPETGPSFIE